VSTAEGYEWVQQHVHLVPYGYTVCTRKDCPRPAIHPPEPDEPENVSGPVHYVSDEDSAAGGDA
jgi:hypothetical protein